MAVKFPVKKKKDIKLEGITPKTISTEEIKTARQKNDKDVIKVMVQYPDEIDMEVEVYSTSMGTTEFAEGMSRSMQINPITVMLERLREICPNAVLQSCKLGYFVQVLVWGESDSKGQPSKGMWQHISGICPMPEIALSEALSSRDLMAIVLSELPPISYNTPEELKAYGAGTMTEHSSGSDNNQDNIINASTEIESMLLLSVFAGSKGAMLIDTLYSSITGPKMDLVTFKRYLNNCLINAQHPLGAAEEKTVIAEGEQATLDLDSKDVDAVSINTSAVGSVSELESVDAAPWANEEEMTAFLSKLAGKQCRGKRKFHNPNATEDDDGYVIGEYMGTRVNTDTGRVSHTVRREVSRKKKATEVIPETLRLAPISLPETE